MTTTATLAPATSTAPAGAADHEVSVATAAQDLGVKDVTVRRYLRQGKLARLGGGVSADSVEAYRTSRDAGKAKFTAGRFKKAGAYTSADPIQAACAAYSSAAELARRGDREKRNARKVLDVVDDGVYGSWSVERADSGRQVADLAEITRIFLANGLGDVPMKDVAPSLKVARVAA